MTSRELQGKTWTKRISCVRNVLKGSLATVKLIVKSMAMNLLTTSVVSAAQLRFSSQMEVKNSTASLTLTILWKNAHKLHRIAPVEEIAN